MEKLAFFDQTGFILTRSSAVAHLGWGGAVILSQPSPPNIGQPLPKIFWCQQQKIRIVKI